MQNKTSSPVISPVRIALSFLLVVALVVGFIPSASVSYAYADPQESASEQNDNAAALAEGSASTDSENVVSGSSSSSEKAETDKAEKNTLSEENDSFTNDSASTGNSASSDASDSSAAQNNSSSSSTNNSDNASSTGTNSSNATTNEEAQAGENSSNQNGEIAALAEEESEETNSTEAQDEYAAENLGEENSWRYTGGERISSEEGATTDLSDVSDGLSLSSVVNGSGGKVFNWFDKFSKGYYTGTSAYRGVDVSYHNGTINWSKVKKAGVDYAIIRCGYGMNYSSQDDEQWVNNVKGCIANDIPFGVYIYSYATNTSRASSEADHVLRCLKKAGITVADLSYPIYFDMEDSSTANSDLAAIATTFCNKIEAAGGTVGVYANKSWFESKLTASCFSKWTKWVAQWNTTIGLTYSGLSNFTSGNGMWQFSDAGSVSGISGRCDLNYTFMEPDADTDGNIVYKVHIQDKGWTKQRADGQSAGTTGRSKRLEAITISRGTKLSSSISGSIRYKVHIQDKGWSGWKYDGAQAGTTGQSKRLEGIKIELTGDLAKQYDVYYRVHAQDYGWLGWAKNGALAGTEGLSKRLESIQIVLCKKGTTPSGYDSSKKASYQGWLSGQAHIQDIGWKSYAKTSATATLAMGTTGKSKRLEGIKLSLPSSSTSGLTGSIRYRSHIQDIGWQGWRSDGALSGTTGRSKRLEAIKIELTGNIAKKYDIYYRVHVQDYGWLGWAKNGASAGTEGKSKRMEKVEVKLVKKGTTPSGYDSSKKAFIK